MHMRESFVESSFGQNVRLQSIIQRLLFIYLHIKEQHQKLMQRQIKF